MIGEAPESIVARGELAGAVTVIWRDGRPVDSTSVGVQDLNSGRPIRRDTLFRIASMTKPITSTVALMLHEEGRFELDDPITKWAPELSILHDGPPQIEGAGPPHFVHGMLADLTVG